MRDNTGDESDDEQDERRDEDHAATTTPRLALFGTSDT